MRTYRRLFGFLRPYRRALWGSLLLAWAAMGVTVTIPWLIGQAINTIEEGRRPDILPIVIAVIGVAVLRLGLTIARRLIAGRVSLSVEVDLRERLYSHLQRLELGFFDASQTGQLMSRATSDLQSIRFFLGYGLIFLTQTALAITLASVAMLIMNPQLALLALAPMPFAFLVAARYQRRSRPAMREVQQRLAELTAQAEEGVSGIRVVKAFAREEYQLHRFRGAVSRVFEQSMRTTRLQAVFTPLIGFLPQIGTALVLLVGGSQVIEGRLSLGEMTAFYTYLLMLIGPIRMLAMALSMFQRAVASGDRLFAVLDREPRITSPPGAPPPPDGAGRIEFEGVSLAYGEDGLDGEGAAGGNGVGGEGVGVVGDAAGGAARAAALSGVSLTIEPGRTVALAGPSGSGKTSLAALIPRLYDPSEGSVRIDGVDLREVDLASLRGEIALVAEESFLFSATIAENIAYARPGAGREQVVEAARLAQADGFIRALDHGYDTVVGERGLTLSGGQRQRVAIARALLANPRILILDDATSSLDAATEQEIRAGLEQVMRGRTTIVIAHRLSTLALADEVIVLDRGRIAERGSHEELARGGGFYTEIAAFGLNDEPGRAATADDEREGSAAGATAGGAAEGSEAGAAAGTAAGKAAS